MEFASQLGICSGRLLGRAPFLCRTAPCQPTQPPHSHPRRAKTPIYPPSSYDATIALDVTLIIHHRRKRGRVFSITYTRYDTCISVYLHYFLATAHVLPKTPGGRGCKTSQTQFPSVTLIESYCFTRSASKSIRITLFHGHRGWGHRHSLKSLRRLSSRRCRTAPFPSASGLTSWHAKAQLEIFLSLTPARAFILPETTRAPFRL